MKKLKYQAFSLVELAISGLVISILLAGILQARILVGKARLANARSQTATSPVASMDGLLAWYEATSEKSFSQDEAKDGKKISTWYDLNPKVETVRNNATQTTEALKPVYKDNEINGLPALSFTSANAHNLLLSDSSGMINSSYTAFIVGQRKDDSTNYFIGGTSNVDNSNFHLGYEDDTTLRISQLNNGLDLTVVGFGKLSPNIIVTTFNFTHIKGRLITSLNLQESTHNTTQGLIAYDGATLGANDGDYLEGSIGEVIIFKRYLKVQERESIEEYLKKKWGIEIN